jgi:glycine dehydrogenase subunit 1
LRYIPHTDDDVKAMLERIGSGSLKELFAAIIPERLQARTPLDLPPGIDEPTLLGELSELGGKNRVARPYATDGTVSFAGCGLVPHAIPTAVDMLLMRSEFYTSYTPYQPEVSQGTLQAIFEFQTMGAELFGLDVANASMYDGSTACAEAVLMARRLTSRPRVLLAAGLHPEYAQVVHAYLGALEGAVVELVPREASGTVDHAALQKMLGDDVACVVVQTPSYLGLLEDVAEVARLAHEVGALVVTATTEPVALAVMRSPGEAGADIACGEGLGLALPPQMGGPGVGLFAAHEKHVRALPGRLVGETVDHEGRRGYVLTLATREQHIRRERATSNICTNEGLVALAFTIHMAILGRRGFAEMARLSYSKASYLREGVRGLGGDGYSLRFPDRPAFNEIAVRVRGGDADRVVDECAQKHGVCPGVALGRFEPELRDTLLVSVSELHRREDLDRLLTTLRTVGGAK